MKKTATDRSRQQWVARTILRDIAATIPDTRNQSELVPRYTAMAIRLIRIELDISQSTLGELTGLSQPSISAIESGKGHTIHNLSRIARACGIDIFELFNLAYDLEERMLLLLKVRTGGTNADALRTARLLVRATEDSPLNDLPIVQEFVARYLE